MRPIFVVFFLCFLSLCASAALAADHPWRITAAEGDTSITFGVLAQPQLEVVRTDSGTADSQDIFLRRFRLIVGGQIAKKFSFFVDTDSPNLGKGTPIGTKVEDRIYIQDAQFTYSFLPQLQVDAGMLMVAQSHNACQSAATLLGTDYGAYTFIASEPTGSRVGRDYGAQARGYLFNRHFEYRIGVFQGSRTKTSANPGTSNGFRYTGRAVWYPFEAETGFFYTGTTLGTRKILSIGAAFDHQMDYNAHSVDVFYDWPVRSGDGITLQAAYTRFDGGTTFPQLPKENVWFVEGGYYNRDTKLGPFVQLSNRLATDSETADLKKYVGGIAYWASGHRFNVKFGVGRFLGVPSAESWQFVLQAQAFVY